MLANENIPVYATTVTVTAVEQAALILVPA